jgi:outer membrane protein TolC
MKTSSSSIVLMLMLSASLRAQPMSLRQCIEYSKRNSFDIRIADIEAKSSNQKMREQFGGLLPQIDVSGTVTDHTEIATQMLPGELMGKPGTYVPVKFGTQYNAANSVTLSQKIFDASAWFALGAARVSKDRSGLRRQQSEETTYYQVSLAYVQALIARKQMDNLKAILEVSRRTLESIEQRLSNGMVRNIDVDKIRVSFNNTRTLMQSSDLKYRQAVNNLKYAIGMPMDQPVSFFDSLETLLVSPPDSVSISSALENRLDFRIQDLTVKAYRLNLRNTFSEYLPALTLTADASYSAMRSDFNVFDEGKDWFRSSSVSLRLSVPLFSGFQRASRVAQARLDLMKARENSRWMEQSIQLEVTNDEIRYTTALDNTALERENLILAENVYQNTQLEFRQGTSSSLEMVQAESSLRETQNNYYSRLLDLATARIEREKANGTLMQFIINLR